MTVSIGASAFGRSSVVVIRDGEPRAALCEESLSRLAHDATIPRRAFQWCLEAADVESNAISKVVFAEKPVERFIRVLHDLVSGFPHTYGDFLKAIPLWLGQRLWLKNDIVSTFETEFDRVEFVSKMEAQSMAAFWTSGFESASVVIVDDISEWATFAVADAHWLSGEAKISPSREIRHPASLSAPMMAVADYLGLASSTALQRLSPQVALGSPSLLELFEEVLPGGQDGSFSVSKKHIRRRLGQARFTKATRFLLDGEMAGGKSRDDLISSSYHIIAKRLGAALKEVRSTSSNHRLCLGGSLFQCPNIARFALEKSGFDEIHICPYPDEVGAALGAAIIGNQDSSGAGVRADRAPFHGSLLNSPTWDVGEELPPGVVDVTKEVSNQDLMRAIQAGQIIAWGEGTPEIERMPSGRRAIFCDARNDGALERLMDQVKLADERTPFIVAVSSDHLTELQMDSLHLAQRHSLATVSIGETLRSNLSKSFFHEKADVLLRVIEKKHNPRLHAFLEDAARAESKPVVLAMSSLNRRNDPCAMTLADSMTVMRRSPIDYLVWENLVFAKDDKKRSHS